jgi:hypothetical protein
MIYAAPTVTTEETNRTGSYKSEIPSQKIPLWGRHSGELSDVRRKLSATLIIKR